MSSKRLSKVSLCQKKQLLQMLLLLPQSKMIIVPTISKAAKWKDLRNLYFGKLRLWVWQRALRAGVMLTYGGLTSEILESLGFAGEKTVGLAGEYFASVTALGAVGASFGINRDIFRQIFDQTDLWFRGFVSHGHSQKVLLDSPAPSIAQEPSVEKAPNAQPIAYEGHVKYPESNTHFRDQQIARARDAMMKMDHTQMVPN